jgi:hypothetical protein
MTRTKVVAGPEGSVIVELTKEENEQRDAEEKAWADGATKRNALAEIQRLEGTVSARRIRDMTTDAGKKWVEDVEALIATERAKL